MKPLIPAVVNFVFHVPPCGGVMVTPEEMRLFALECLRWSDEAANASQRDLMVRIAKTWMNTASAIERRVMDGDRLGCADLRMKLD